MQHPRQRTAVCAVAVLALAMLVPAVLQAQAQDVAATVQVDTGEEQMEMKVTVGQDRSRMDLQQMSMVFEPEAMTMIMHEQRRYMRWTKQMMERMQEMTGRMGGMMPGGDDEADAMTVDPESMTFEETGRTDTIAGVEAFEVRWTSDQHQGSIWMTRELDAGLFEVFGGMLQHMQDMEMPFMDRMTEGDNPMDMRRYFEYAQAQGMPDGRVVRIVNDNENVTITLQNVEQGPFPASAFEPPADYEEQEMPMMQRP